MEISETVQEKTAEQYKQTILFLVSPEENTPISGVEHPWHWDQHLEKEQEFLNPGKWLAARVEFKRARKRGINSYV